MICPKSRADPNLNELSRCGWESLQALFTTITWDHKAVPGAVIAIQTFGDFLGFNSHLHILISDGCFHQNGMYIAKFNVRTISKMTIQKNYKGILSHYLLITDALIKKHHAEKQEVGTGWIGSKNSLFHELNRGVKWLFSNNAVKLQLICNSLL